jgi:hypothetical protein
VDDWWGEISSVSAGETPIGNDAGQRAYACSRVL